MKLSQKIVAFLLCLTLAGGAAVPAASAAFVPGSSVNEEENVLAKAFYNAVDVVIDKVVGLINQFLPAPDAWAEKEAYGTDTFMPGMEEFLAEPADGAYWSIGYANASILTGDELDGQHFVGGSLSLSDKTATQVMDDLKVRTIAMSDNSGRGTVVFVVLDSYGLASSEVSAMRKELADYCAQNDIVSLNIAVLHQHSAVDTFGLNGSIAKALLNPLRTTPVNGLNESYMKNLHSKVQQTVKEAVSSMTAGTLYHGSADFSEFVTDKRDPQVLDTQFDRFRFVPADGSRETWFTTSCIHCVGNGAGGTVLTGDYPYYMEQIINEQYDANFLMMLGAEQGTSQDASSVRTEDMTKTEYFTAYAGALTERFASIDNETVVEPLLNIRAQEVTYTITNQILIFAGKMGLLTNTVVKNGKNFEVATEIGYMELGTRLAVALVPGEAAAEIFYGGCLEADKSWTGTAWSYAPLADAAQGKELIVFGLVNDQIGYIIPDNDYMALLEPANKSLELVSTGRHTASAMTEDFEALIASVKSYQ